MTKVVNKMDLNGYNEEVFETIKSDYCAFLKKIILILSP